MAQREIQRNLSKLEVDLKRLEAEYNMFFAGRLARPPVETRSRVAALVKQYDRTVISNYGDRFRFSTLQARYAALVELWDRGLRAREEGRSGPFMRRARAPAAAPARSGSKIFHVAAFADPLKETDKLHELYNALVEARREAGAEAVPFHKFADLVRGQVAKLRGADGGEVAFRVAMKDGRVQLTARALTGSRGEEDG